MKRGLFLLAVLAVGACGSKKPAAKILHVDIRGMKFEPDSLAVAVGDTVEWTNDDLVPHSVTSSSFDSKAIAPHATWSYVARTGGDFAYNCTFHPMMVAAIIVR